MGKDLIKLDFDGYAIGGLAVGEPTEELYKLTDFTTTFVPEGKPRYLMVSADLRTYLNQLNEELICLIVLCPQEMLDMLFCLRGMVYFR